MHVWAESLAPGLETLHLNGESRISRDIGGNSEWRKTLEETLKIPEETLHTGATLPHIAPREKLPCTKYPHVFVTRYFTYAKRHESASRAGLMTDNLPEYKPAILSFSSPIPTPIRAPPTSFPLRIISTQSATPTLLMPNSAAPATNMLTKVPESPKEDGVSTPDTPTVQPSTVSPEQKSTHQSSRHPVYPPPHQPNHEDTEQPTHKPKRYEDILAYEDKWIGWDGPVWCSRYGRFENQEDAAVDDGYKSVGQVPHQDLGLERCEKHGCNCRVPFQHRSYVKDIQRRVEPMVESLIRLESQVGKLIHHTMKDGESMLHLHHNGHDGSKHEAFGAPPDGHRGRTPSEPIESLHEAAYRQRYDEAPHPGQAQRPREPAETSLKKLEDRVESLMKQVQHMMKNSQDRFEKYGENIVPPGPEERGEVHKSHRENWNEGREYYQGGR